ncbi:MAG: phosphatidylserine decarboxylase [Proteobacteria bacterium]|nr:phosphatidylserine decarboxylase [Pseudomonadota bacterium]MYJ94781.1 phosphatidylserine decarboxylase [Pseudomonadota bacterium]
MNRPSVLIQQLLPQRLMGRLVYRLARCNRSWISRPLIAWFAARYRVDLKEAEHSRLENYTSLNEFFTRRLKREARPIDGDERTLISPVDGFLTQFGCANGGEMIQAKGLHYRLEALLGEPAERVAALMSGAYATLYLAPHQYHRVHLPLAGALQRTRYIPGKRYSVNAHTAAVLPGLFCRNERVVCWFETTAGPTAVVLVGALNVSSISTAWLGEIASGRARVWDEAGHSGREFGRGAEIGRFNLGSTVVLVLPPGLATWRPELAPGQPVRMGQALASLP